MVAFRIVQRIRAPPGFVVDWWLDYRSDDAALTRDTVQRTVDRIDDRRIHLTTTSEFGGRLRTTDGTVARTGPTSWHMTGHVSSDGLVVSTMQTAYAVEGTPDGCRVAAEFEFVGRTLPWRLALAVSGYALRRRQRAAFRDYAAAIERDYAARAAGAPPSPSVPPPDERRRPR